MSSSKRGSEVDIGCMLNGTGSAGGGMNVSTAGLISGVICSRPGYYIKPSLEELDKRVDNNGNCIINGFEVGRLNFGKIKYTEPINVANTNIDEIVFFRHKEVVVYPDDENKPELGKGLNAPAEIELERVFPLDKQTNELVRSPEKIRGQNYEQKLRKACDRLGAEFISYSDEKGVWRFRVSHFSKYGLEDDDDEEEDPNAAGGKQPQKGVGLGGISQQKLHQQQQQQRSSLKSAPGTRPGLGGDAPATMQMQLPGRMSLPHFMQPQLQGPSHPPFMEPSQMGPPPPASDVELNPLSPCDSDDEDDDDDLDDDDEDDNLEERVGMRRPSVVLAPQMPPMQSPASSLKYRPILKDAGSEKTQMMKSVMGMEEFNDGDQTSTVPITDSYSQGHPPAKKSRPSRRVSIIPNLENIEEGNRLKERLTTAKRMPPPPTPQPSRPPPPAIIPQEPVKFSTTTKIENLFGSLESKNMSTGLRLQGAPRVCFLPNGHFLTMTQSRTNKGFKGQVNVEQIASYADKQAIAPLSANFRSALEKQMESRLKHSGVLFLQHIKVLEAEIRRCTVPQVKIELEQELVIWELCDILWPGEEHLTEETLDDEGFLLEQRRRLCTWLRNHAEILFGGEYNSKDNSVLGLLKKGQAEEACLTAIQEGCDWLGVLLSTEPHLLLDFSEDMRVLEGMGEDTPDIFALLAGNIRKLSCLTKRKVECMSNYEWFQYFALYLWFEGPVKSRLPMSVEKAIPEFEGMMREILGERECAMPGIERSSVSNLAMHVLKMYSCTGYPVKILLSPRTCGFDCLDYKLAWLLMRDLEEIGYLPEDDCYKGVCMGYVGMLEGIGMWQWGHFVLGHLPGPDVEAEEGEQVQKEVAARDAFCRRLLERNIKVGVGYEEKFLVYQLGIPEEVIYSVKSWRNKLADRRFDEQMWYLGNNRDWQESFNVLMTYLETGQPLDLIGDRLPAKAKSMQKHLRRLEANQERIVGWEVHGKMLSNYLALKDPAGIEMAVVSFLESVIKFSPSNKNQCAFLLDMALSAQKVIQLLLAEAVVSPELKTKILDNLVLFLENSAPKEYFEGLRSFINVGLAPTKKVTVSPPFFGMGYTLQEQRVLENYQVGFVN